MTEAEGLSSALQLGQVPDQELVGVLGGVLPLSRWESGNRVSYFHPEKGHALDLVYDRRGGITACEPGPGMTQDLVEELAALVTSALGTDAGYEIRREVLFSVPETKGYWRHGDDWQIVPAPPEAPRPSFLMGEFPFVLEFRIRSSSNTTVMLTRWRRRAWELQLVLALVLRGARITRELEARPHHWVLSMDATPDGAHTVYLNEGYMVGGGFVSRAEDLSDPSSHPRIAAVPDDEYDARRGLDPERALDVPASLDDFFRRFEESDLLTREQLLRAAYWLDTASRAWDMSKSLSYVAAITAVEALVPSADADPCPCCGLNRGPGPTARFQDFVESYAGATEAAGRKAMYRMRSMLVHGGGLHALDVPRAWGALTPGDQEHRELHDSALTAARMAIRGWFLDATAGAGPESAPGGPG